MPKKHKTTGRMPKKPTAAKKPLVKASILKKAYRLTKQSGEKRMTPAMSLDDIVAASQTAEGFAQTTALIRRHGGPLYSTDPKHPDFIVQVSPDGTRRIGRFVNRKFMECIIPTVKEQASMDQNAPPADPPPMSPDNLGKLAHRLAKNKNRALSAKLTSEITRGFYATNPVANPVNPRRRAKIPKP